MINYQLIELVGAVLGSQALVATVQSLLNRRKERAEAAAVDATAEKTAADSALDYAKAVREDLESQKKKYEELYGKYVDAVKEIAAVRGELEAYKRLMDVIEQRFHVRAEPPEIKDV